MRTTGCGILLCVTLALTGCLTLEPRYGSPHTAETQAKTLQEQAEPAKPVEASQVSRENARQTAEALRLELDRAARE